LSDAADCSIQKSALTAEPCLWFGKDTGSHDPETGECLSRAHLTRKMAGVIWRVLKRFEETGELGERREGALQNLQDRMEAPAEMEAAIRQSLEEVDAGNTIPWERAKELLDKGEEKDANGRL
jgi:hypothetical protein